MAKDYYNIPFIQLSKENLRLLRENLETNEIGEVIGALYPYIYEGIEPTFKSKHINATWNNIISTIDRQAEGYVEQVEAGKYGKKGGRPRKGETKEEYQERKAKENTPSTYDIQPNKDFEEEKPVTTPQEPEKPVEQPKNNQEMTIDCKPEIPQPQISSDMGVHISNMIQDPDVLTVWGNTQDEAKAAMKYLVKYKLTGKIDQPKLARTFKQTIKQTA